VALPIEDKEEVPPQIGGREPGRPPGSPLLYTFTEHSRPFVYSRDHPRSLHGKVFWNVPGASGWQPRWLLS